MVARGDLGVEIGVSHVPLWQKKICDIAKKYNKPIVTCFIDGVSMGARCSTGVNYCDYGKNLANLSYTILVRNIFPEHKFEISKYDKVYEEVS